MNKVDELADDIKKYINQIKKLKINPDDKFVLTSLAEDCLYRLKEIKKEHYEVSKRINRITSF
jgi:hypothetical protein